MGKKISSPISYFNNKLFDKIVRKKKAKKVKYFEVPKFHEFDKLITINYNVRQLKKICIEHGQKKSGNKGELIFRLYNFLKYSYYATKIQKIIRKKLTIKYLNLKGRAKPADCVNDTDFITLDHLKEIPFNQFFSYKESDNLIFGFDICSLYNYIEKIGKDVKNPYSRAGFQEGMISTIRDYLRISKVLGRDVNIKLEDDTEKMSEKKKLEFKVLSVFSKIDDLGNITDAKWFLELNRRRHILFVKELYDIWFYRASLTILMKSKIWPPTGNPFFGVSIQNMNNLSTRSIIKKSIHIIEGMVTKAEDRSHKVLGGYYVLGALTLVSKGASEALPWLHSAVI